MVGPFRFRAIAAGAAIFAAAFVYVLPEATELIDDHFMHVAWGRQLLYGRWFIRDMAVLGLPLQSALSAAFEWAVGYRLLSEGLIIALAFATGALLTFVLARRISGSIGIALAAAAIQVAAAPRTYGYPKIVLYAAAILVFWKYIEQPTRRHLALIGAVLTAGFYLRHDHGVYLAVVGVGVLSMRHLHEWKMGVRRLLKFAAVCGLVTAPYLLYAHNYVGVSSYVSDLRAMAERESRQNRFDAWPEWPLATLDDLVQSPADPQGATIGVRWTAGVSEDARRAAAAVHHLTIEDDEPVESGRFLLTDTSRTNVLALVSDPIVEDTAGIDRRTGEVPLQGLRLGSLHLLSGLDAPPDSAAFLFYVVIALIPATLIALMRSPHRDEAGRLERLKISTVVLVGVVTAIGFLREPLTIRIADAVVAPLVLFAWWAGRALRDPDAGTHARHRQLIVAALAVAIMIPAMRSVVVIGAVVPRVERLRHLPAIWQQLAVSPPFDGWRATGSAKYQAVRYVRACTSPDDPLLVLWFAPDLYYYSGRPFAGRLGFYMEGYWASAQHERENIAAIERDRPTLVLMEPGRRETDLYTYPQLLTYVANKYRELGVLQSSDGRRVRVHARNDRTPTGVDRETGWPCFGGHPPTVLPGDAAGIS